MTTNLRNRTETDNHKHDMKAIVWESAVGYTLMLLILAAAIWADNAVKGRLMIAFAIVVWAVAAHQMHSQNPASDERE